MRRPILNHLRRGELVYEPFLGSGTTLAAAELTQRVCYRCGRSLIGSGNPANRVALLEFKAVVGRCAKGPAILGNTQRIDSGR